MSGFNPQFFFTQVQMSFNQIFQSDIRGNNMGYLFNQGRQFQNQSRRTRNGGYPYRKPESPLDKEITINVSFAVKVKIQTPDTPPGGTTIGTFKLSELGMGSSGGML